MLSVETVKDMLGRGCPLQDDEVEALRDEMYRLVRFAMTVPNVPSTTTSRERLR